MHRILTVFGILLFSLQQFLFSEIVIASTTLSDNENPQRYDAINVIDGDSRTVWVEGKDGEGVAEYLLISFDNLVSVNRIVIQPGYFDSRWWESNNRIKNAIIHLDMEKIPVTFNDEMQEYNLEFDRTKKINTFIIEIVDVYPGSKWDDTCISEISFFQNNNKYDFSRVNPNYSVVPEYSFSYDDKNRIVNYTYDYHVRSGDSYGTEHFVYDNQDRVISDILDSDIGLSIDTYSYDGNRRINEMFIFDRYTNTPLSLKRSSYIFIDEYQYNGSDLQQINTYRNKEISPINEVVFEYENGNIVTETSAYSNTEFIYDDNNFVQKIIHNSNNEKQYVRIIRNESNQIICFQRKNSRNLYLLSGYGIYSANNNQLSKWFGVIPSFDNPKIDRIFRL